MARLSTRQAADRLGVKPETVYAYVSRGLLVSRRGPGGRASTFDPAEVDALARQRGRTGAEAIRTAITRIDGDAYYFRGVDAVELARRHSYEAVARWLWTGELEPDARFVATPEAIRAAQAAVSALPVHSTLLDRLQVATVAAATVDPLRFDLDEGAVTATAERLIAVVVAALPVVGAEPPDDATLARRLWPRLTDVPPDPAALACLDAALVLLIDHDLAASTFAARIAASARAHPYAVVSAGIGALEGPLHGAASGLAHRLLTEVIDGPSAAVVVAEQLRAGRRIPGLGHRIYHGPDPRAEVLLEALAEVPGTQRAMRAARAVADTASGTHSLHPNVDLALAVLTSSTRMPAGAGEAIFAIGRAAGWIAHALEEYQERPLRMRPTGMYSGPMPPQPVPGWREPVDAGPAG